MHTVEMVLGEAVCLELKPSSQLWLGELRESYLKGGVYRVVMRPEGFDKYSLRLLDVEHYRKVFEELEHTGIISCSGSACVSIVGELVSRVLEVARGVDFYLGLIPAPSIAYSKRSSVCSNDPYGRQLCSLLSSRERRLAEEELARLGGRGLQPFEAYMLVEALKAIRGGVDVALAPPPGIELGPLAAVLAAVLDGEILVVDCGGAFSMRIPDAYTPASFCEEVFGGGIGCGYRVVLLAGTESLSMWAMRQLAVAVDAVRRRCRGLRVVILGNYLYGAESAARLLCGQSVRVIGRDVVSMVNEWRRLVIFFVHAPWGSRERVAREMHNVLGGWSRLLAARGVEGVNALASFMALGGLNPVSGTAAFIPLVDAVDYKLYRGIVDGAAGGRVGGAAGRRAAAYRPRGEAAARSCRFIIDSGMIYPSIMLKAMRELIGIHDYSSLDYAGCIFKLYLAVNGYAVKGVEECLESGGSGLVQRVWSILRDQYLRLRSTPGVNSREARRLPSSSEVARVLEYKDTLHDDACRPRLGVS